MELSTPSSLLFRPPMSLADADRMRRERERQIAKIEAQIEYFEEVWRGPDTRAAEAMVPPRGAGVQIRSRQDFLDWRFRAKQAIGHKQEEHDALLQWVDEEQARLQTAHLRADATLFEQITALARSLAAPDRGPVRLSGSEAAVLNQAERAVVRGGSCP